MKNPYAIGRHVYLRTPTTEDAAGPWHEWFSDEETTRYLGLRFMPNSVEDQLAFLNSVRGATDRIVLAIVDIETDKHIGVCNLSAINWVHRYSDIAVIIGDKQFKSGPYVTDAVSVLLRTAFERLNLRILRSFYVETNEASEVIHKLFRFEEVGRTPDMIWDRDRYVAMVSTVLRREVWQRRRSGHSS